MVDGNIITQIGVGGIFSLMVLKTTFDFLAKRKNGGNGTPTILSMMQQAETDRREVGKVQADVTTHLSHLILDGDQKIASILDHQTDILKDLMTVMAAVHRDIGVVGKDIDRHLTILSEDVIRRIDAHDDVKHGPRGGIA